LDCCLLQQDKKIFDYQITNDEKGLKEQHKKLKKLGYPISETLVCAEKTGMYSYKLLKWMLEKKYNIWVENALAIKKSLGITRGKNDKVDAHRIALYAMRYQDKYKPSELTSDEIQTLQIFASSRKRIIETIKMHKTPLKGSKSILSKQEYKILQNACSSILKAAEKSLKEIDNNIRAYIAKNDKLNKQYVCITSVQGVGPVIACALIVATNGFKQITTAKKMACYAGVAPFNYQSGTSIRGRNRVSYIANKSLKALLHMAAISVIRLDGDLGNYFRRKVAEGKHTMLVLNAVRNKILQRIYACVRENRNYEKNYTKKLA